MFWRFSRLSSEENLAKVANWRAIRSGFRPSGGFRWPQNELKDGTMRSTCRLLVAICCLSVGGGGIATAAPLTNVVFGNLNANGEKELGATSTLIGPGAGSEVWIAQGFNTGTSTSTLSIQSISLGLATLSESTSATVSIYSDNSGSPGSLLFTSSAVAVTGTTQVRYDFPFSGANLTANTGYWAIPSAGVQWFQVAAAGGTPIGLNGSSYSGLGAIESDTTAIVPGEWFSSSARYSISVQAVPEPSTYALAALGLGAAGIVRARRRKSAV